MRFDPSELLNAFEHDEFFPAFQPIIELRTGQLAGFEALARWNHPRLGPIPPDEFIPLIEKAGQIDRLTQIILTKAFACPVLARTAAAVSVNFSPHQLLDFKLPESIGQVAQQYGFLLERLHIEITESALLDDLPRAKAVAQELKALHCQLALDDFGTGYSSLRHLHALPFDELKVDRGFVSSMTESRASCKIVGSVMGLGQSLGMVTVAEGVETAEQGGMLLRMGCDLAQGWLYGKPVRGEELEELIARGWNGPRIAAETALSRNPMRPEGPPGQRLAQLQAIYDGAPVGLGLLDRKLRYVSLNRMLAQMNGTSAEAHLGHTPAEIIPRTFQIVEPYMRRALAGEAVLGVEIYKPAAETTGQPKTLMISYQPVLDEASEVLGISVAVMDITEHKRAEEALREVEDHYRTLVNVGPHVPWVLNLRGEVIEAGARWESITGQPLAEALGHGWLQALHPEDVPTTRDAIRQALENGDSIDIRYRVRQVNGAWKRMRSRGSPRRSPLGELVGLYGVVEEIQDTATAPPA